MVIIFGLLLLVTMALSVYTTKASASSIGMTLTSPTISTYDNGQHRYIIQTHQQVTISTSVRNPHDDSKGQQPVTLLTEIRDEEGITIYLAYQSTTLDPLQQYEAGFSWSYIEAGEYEIRTFAISDLNNPMILSAVRTSPIIVTDDEELLKNAEKITVLDNVPMPDFYEQSNTNYTVKQIADQHELLCGTEYSHYNEILRSIPQHNEYLPYWFPQRVEFRYLQPNETFYRQPCTETYSDVIEYADYVLRGNDTVHLDSFDSVDLFQIETIAQALEYLAYFTYRGGNTDGTGIIPTLGDYFSTRINCDITTDSPVRFIRVTGQDDNSMIIELNVGYDNSHEAGSIEYHTWKFESGGKPLLMSSKKLGQCPAIE